MASVVWTLALSVAVLGAGSEESVSTCPRVRAYDAHVAALIHEGYRRSPAFRALIEQINQSDVIVQVMMSSSVSLQPAGHLQLACATAHGRVLRIVVKRAEDRLWTVAMIAHELQHAVEVASAKEVRDARSFRQFYQRVGDKIGEHQFDTREAREMTSRVWRELGERQGFVAAPPSRDLVGQPR